MKYKEEINVNHEHKDKLEVEKQSVTSEHEEIFENSEEVMKSCSIEVKQDFFSHLLNTQSCTMSYEPINTIIEEINLNHEHADKLQAEKQSIISEHEEIFEDNDEVMNSCCAVVSPDIFSHLLNTQSSIQSSLSEWSDWSYNPNPNIISKNLQEHTSDVILSNNQTTTFDDNFLNLSQLSVWSDWNYEPNNITVNNHVSNSRLFKFLPPSINQLLPYKYLKILGDRSLLQSSQCLMFDVLNEIETNSLFKTDKNFINITDIQVGKDKSELDQCTISKETINSFQVFLILKNFFF